MKAQVQPFFHAGSNTFSYVVSDPNSGQAAIIDPVLDFDAASARTGTTSAQAIVDHISAQALQVQWILETHAHADHLSAAQWLKQRFPAARLAIGEGIRTVQATLQRYLTWALDSARTDHSSTTCSPTGRNSRSAPCPAA